MSTINALLGFNPNEVQAAESFESRPDPVPEGIYKVCANVMKRQNNKNQNGWFWFGEFVVLDGEYQGRKVVHRFNIDNKNERAMAIGRGQMKRFLEVIGNLAPATEDDMLGIPFLAHVKCEKGSFIGDKGEKIETMNNEIVKMEAFNATPQSNRAAEPTAATPAANAAPATVAVDTPPW